MRYKIKDIYLVISSSIIFQSFWLFLQTIKGGYLGRDIEAKLPGIEFGIQSSENLELLRLPGTFFESSILGTFLITNISLLSFALLNKKIKNKKIKKVLIFSIFVGLIGLFLTGSRAIYVITFILFFFLFKKIQPIHKRNIVNFFKQHKLIVIICTTIILSLIGPYLLSRITSSNQIFSKQGSGSYRLELIQYATRMAKIQPITGVGINLSPYYLSTLFTGEKYFVDPAYPHNLIFQLLAETGIIGLSLFIVFIYLIFRPVIKKEAPMSEFHFASIFFLLCAQFYPIFINHTEIISYLFLYLGFSLYNNQNNEK